MANYVGAGRDPIGVPSRIMAHVSSQVYDAISERYRDSKWLLFRHFVERYTVMELLGDLHGQTVLDMACGEGVYARQFKRAGAVDVTGVDISSAMVALAEAQERAEPLGCRYVCADAADFSPTAPVDVVTAIYLLNYARTADQLGRFGRACFRALRPGGRFCRFQRQCSQSTPAGRCVSHQIRSRTEMCEASAARGRRHPVPNHEPRRPDVRVRQLLPEVGHLPDRDARRGLQGLSLGRRDAGSRRASGSVLGRLHGPGAAHRLLRDADMTRQSPIDIVVRRVSVAHHCCFRGRERR